jgi:hypothetical protein
MQAGHVAPCHVTIGPSPSSRTAAKGEISRERRRLPAHVTVTMDLASAGRCDGCRHRIIVAFRSPTQAGTHSTERKSSRAPQSPPLDRAAVAGPPKRRGALRPVPSSPARRARGPGTPVTATDTAGPGRARRERAGAGAVGAFPACRGVWAVGPRKGPGYVERRIAGARHPCLLRWTGWVRSAAWDLGALRYVVHRVAPRPLHTCYLS